jgi:hypothetical protein
MDFNEANFKKLNQFKGEARRWKASNKEQKPPKVTRGKKSQPPKRKKKGKA